MKSYLECYSCFLRQAVDASKIATTSNEIHWKILQAVLEKTITFSKEETPALMGKEIHSLVRELAKNADPYKTFKDEYNNKANELLPVFEKVIESAPNQMLMALKILVIANIIDFGPFGLKQVELIHFFQERTKAELKGNIDPEKFLSILMKSETVLYVADNCGEVIFDAYFINKYLTEKKVYFSVRGGVVLNDVTKNDLEDISFSENVTLIDTGDNAPGVILKNCSNAFLKAYSEADIVVLKGQGNFEGIGIPKRENVFSLLVSKCPVIARHIGCEINDLVLIKLS